MRYVYMALIAVVAVIVLFFSIQNFNSVTVGLFGMSVRMPLSLVVILAYVLGMVTGGALLELMRTWIRGTRRRA
jgi:uncharacterized integral membrane protein